MKTKETIERVIVPGASTYRPIDSIKMLRIYLREDMKRMRGGLFINPLRWLMGEDCSRMKFYLYVLRCLEYVTNKYKRGG